MPEVGASDRDFAARLSKAGNSDHLRTTAGHYAAGDRRHFSPAANFIQRGSKVIPALRTADNGWQRSGCREINKPAPVHETISKVVLGGGLEPPQITPYAPQTYASTNSAIRACP